MPSVRGPNTELEDIFTHGYIFSKLIIEPLNKIIIGRMYPTSNIYTVFAVSDVFDAVLSKPTIYFDDRFFLQFRVRSESIQKKVYLGVTF